MLETRSGQLRRGVDDGRAWMFLRSAHPAVDLPLSTPRCGLLATGRGQGVPITLEKGDAMDDRFNVSERSAAVSAETQEGAIETTASGDGPPDEIEPGTAVKEEVDRLVRHPREEASRLHGVEEKGESGATPYLYIFGGLRIILPAAALLLAIALLTYYLS
jgi:hypothetical protein